MDEKLNETNTNTSNVVVTDPVTTASQVEKPIEAVAVQNNSQPKEEAPAKEITAETKEMIDKNKKVLSSSPQMVDSSSINVNRDSKNIASESNVVSETVIDTDLNNLVFEEEQKEGAFEEVSLSLDNNALELTESENDPNSIFNKVEVNNNNNNQVPTKMGEEKHRFPFFMVLILIILIVAAFNIDTVSGYIKKYLNKEEPAVEEEKKKKDEISLKDVLAKLDESELIIDLEGTKNIEVTISLDETNNRLSFVTANYLKITDAPNLTVVFNKEGSDLVATCTDENMEFCEIVTTATVLSIAEVEETYSKELADYIKENIVLGTININGFIENPTSEGRVFRISLTNKISLPESK